MQKIIALIIVLFSITYTQAQDWINNESTLLYEENLTSNENVQCIEEYTSHHLLTSTNRIETDQYAFSLWENGNNVLEGFLQDTNCVVLDMEILEDTVYFCGYRKVDRRQVGYIGRFALQQFINNQNCGYEITDINQSIKLKKLVAYDTFGNDHIVAIGVNTLDEPIIVDLFPNSICNIFKGNEFPYERLSDITVGDKYVVIAGEDINTRKLVINTFFKEDLTDPTHTYQFHYEYDFSAILDRVPLLSDEEQVKVSYLDSNLVAITSSAMADNNYYTLTSIFNEYYLNIINTQMIAHNDKKMIIKDTEYNPITQQLYILEDNNLCEMDDLCSYIILVNPKLQTNYIVQSIKPSKGYKINDIISLSESNKVLGAGVNSYNNIGVFSKDINSLEQYCNTKRNLRVSNLSPVFNSHHSIYQLLVPIYSIDWWHYDFQIDNNLINIECENNY
jgi:hypothetical protein